jgi:hypothetical protein
MKMVWDSTTICICVLLFLVLIVLLCDADCKRKEAAAIYTALTKKKKTAKFGGKAYWAPLHEQAKQHNKQNMFWKHNM